MDLKPCHVDAFGVLGGLLGRLFDPAQPDDGDLSAGESLHLVDDRVGSHQPVPLARPIFSFEELCPCLVTFPAEPNLRLWMSTQVMNPCREGWLRKVGIGTITSSPSRLKKRIVLDLMLEVLTAQS